jgi:hypothetical protein
VREQAPVLRHVRDAERRQFVRGHRRQVLPAEADRAAARADQAGDHTEQGGLARAVRPDHAHRLARLHAQADAEERLEVAVARVDAGKVQGRLGAAHAARDSGGPR